MVLDFIDNPTMLVQMKSGYACIGDTQFLKGYCVLFSDPAVASLNDLQAERRDEFLSDMGVVGDAIIQVCNPLRINYGILGNSYPHLHAHMFPRYEDEPKDLRKRNVWQYPETYWAGEQYKFNEEQHGDLKKELEQAIKDLM